MPSIEPQTRTSIKPSNHASPNGTIGAFESAELAVLSLIRASAMMRRIIESHLAAYGLSQTQWGILRELRERERAGMPPPRVSTLGAALAIQPPSLCATLDRMERVGLVERLDDPHDQRTRLVGITETGRALVERVRGEHSRWIEDVMVGVSESEQATLAGALARLAERLAVVTARVPHAAATSHRAEF